MRDLRLALKCKGWWFFPILCIVVLSSYALPPRKQQSQVEALQFLNRVRAASDIRAPGMPPFLLSAHIMAAQWEGESKLDGTYALTWASPDRWRQEITFPGYHRVRVASQGKLWTAANVPFEPVRVWELSELFNLASQWTIWPGESATLQRSKKHKGVVLQCAKIEGHLEPGREVCADTSSWLPANMEMLLPYDPGRTSFVYADYQAGAGRRFPRVMRAFEGKRLALDVRVDELVPDLNPDESSFSPPRTSAVSWDWCADAKPPEAIEKPVPRYPQAAMASRQQGVVSVYAVIGVDGSPHNLTVVRSAGHELDAASVAAVVRWKYRPAMCGNRPIPFEKVIDVTYSLHE